MTKKQDSGSEFSRVIEVESLGDAPAVFPLEANATERAALARRFGLPAIDSLKAKLRLQRTHGGTAIRLSGRLEADVTQSCVVTLDPVENRVEEEFTILYAASAATEAIETNSDSEESWAEPLPRGGLDIGEVVAQHLSLALDPYPRRPDAAIAEPGAEQAAPAKESPFAALAKLKSKPS
jgi:uncharacterized metal-binding protein YceD (DUF177 family)